MWNNNQVVELTSGRGPELFESQFVLSPNFPFPHSRSGPLARRRLQLLEMSVAGRRTASSGSSTTVEIVLLPGLKNCLLNLPASLVALLLNANTIAQNVVVELQYRQPPPAGQKPPPTPQSVYLGWTGMQSQTKLSPLVGREGIRGSSGNGRSEQEVPTVEVDATLARRLGLSDGMKVCGREWHVHKVSLLC